MATAGSIRLNSVFDSIDAPIRKHVMCTIGMLKPSSAPVGNSSAVKNALSSTLAEMPVPVPLTVRDHLKKSAGV